MTYDLRRLRRKGSSAASPAPTATPSPPTASASRSSTPSSTTGCFARSWPPTNPRPQPDLRTALSTIDHHVDDYAAQARLPSAA